MRVLLLNPPGSRNYIRDYFCSKLAKSYYKSPPVVLLMQSGILAEAHEVAVLDAIVENLNASAALARIQHLHPDVVVALAGAASWDEDRDFFRQMKACCPAYLIVNGDVMLEDAEERLQEAPAVDAVLINFITPDILTLIAHHDGKPIPNTIYRVGESLIRGEIVPMSGEFHIPRPQHELFPLKLYRFPFMLAHPMTAMLTDYGCPFRCTFCVIPGLGFGVRPLEDILDELRHLQRLGVKEIFFLDQTFGARRKRTLELCRAMKTFGFSFRWSCFSRADVLNAEMLLAMRQAGCHTIIVGVESGSDEILAAYNKKMRLDQVRAIVRVCRQLKIRTAATFMLGLPGETMSQAQATIALALSLPLDYAAFNVAVPRAGTRLRSQAIAKGLISASLHIMDQSGCDGAMGTKELTADEVLALRRIAIRKFYLRPGYLVRRLLTLRSAWDLLTQLADGWGVVQDALRCGKGGNG